MLLATDFGKHPPRQKRPCDAWGPFPRSAWIHPNTPEDDLDGICFKIWKRIKSPGHDLDNSSPDNANKPTDLVVKPQDVPVKDANCDSTLYATPSTDNTKIPRTGGQAGLDEIIQMVEREFQGLSKEHGIQSRDPEVCNELGRHGDDPKQDERQERSARELQKRVPSHSEEAKRDSCQPAEEDFPMLPCPSRPSSSRVCQRVAATWPSSPTRNNMGGTQNVKEIQDFLRNVLLNPGQEKTHRQGLTKGAVQRERPLEMSQQLLVIAKQGEAPESQTSCGPTHIASANRDPIADGQCMDFHSVGRAKDSARRPAGPRDHVKRHPFLERSTKPENIVTGAYNGIPLHGAAESESHLRSAGSTRSHTWALSGMPTADHSRTKPVRPPPGFQPLQHLFPQLFPLPKMTLQPRLSLLQPVNRMNFVLEGPSPIFFFLPGQPAMPILLPGNVLDPSCLSSGLSTVALPTSMQGQFSRQRESHSFAWWFLANNTTCRGDYICSVVEKYRESWESPCLCEVLPVVPTLDAAFRNRT